MNLLFQCIISFIAISYYVTGEEDVKRLLLNNPDIVQDRLNSMENMLAILNKTVKQQCQSIQQQSRTIQLQQAEIRVLQSTKGILLTSQYIC